METFSVSNFRIFDKQGVKINFRPVTILTGTNSSGKSSFVKSMYLMKKYCEQFGQKFTSTPISVQLDLTDSKLQLSGFKDILNSTCNSEKQISFSTNTTSKYAPFDFDVEYTFVPSPTRNTMGILKSIILYHKDEIVVSIDATEGGINIPYIDLKGLLMKAFMIFIKGKTYQACEQGTIDFKTDEMTITGAISPCGEDVFDWKRFDYPSFRSCTIQSWNPRNAQDDLTLAIRAFERTGILFYSPVFDALEGLSKSETIQLLQDVQDPFDDQTFNSLKNEIISHYKNANEISFIDFFGRIESETFTSFAARRDNFGVEFGSFSDLFSGILSDYCHYDNIHVDFIPKDHDLFKSLCKFVHTWEWNNNSVSDYYYRRNTQITFDGFQHHSSCHILSDLYSHYIEAFLSDILIPVSLNGFELVGDSFTSIQRLHSYEEKSSFVAAIKRYLLLSSSIIKYQKQYSEQEADSSKLTDVILFPKKIDYQPGEFINKWLSKLDIADAFIVKEDEDGLGFKLYLDHNGHRSALADHGHGITQLVNILLQIECAILQKYSTSTIDEDVVYRSTKGKFYNLILAIEEPEVSLHPSMQSQLAFIFYDAVSYGIHFIIETHSEYLVRKTQAIVANFKSDEDFSRNPFVVYYFNSNGTAYDLEYSRSGRFQKSFGFGFFDEASRSSIEILKREREMKS